MSNPKYEGIPGIDDQPDVYETPDVPDPETSSTEYYDASDDTTAIEVLHISAKTAFEKFNIHTLDGSGADFSDRLKRKKAAGYRASHHMPTTWELAARGEPESISEKANRIECELHELAEDVSKLHENSDDEETQNMYVLLTNKLLQCNKIISDVSLEIKQGSRYKGMLYGPEASGIRRLFSDISLFKKTESEGSTASKEPSTSSQVTGSVTYNLEIKPGNHQLHLASRITELEQRLKKAESITGTTSEKLTNLTVATRQKSLVDAAKVLNSKISLIDLDHLDVVEGRISSLSQKMDAMVEKRNSQQDLEQLKFQVNEMHACLKKQQDMLDVVPEVVDRLVVLETLHKEALAYASSVRTFSEKYEEVTTNLESCKKRLSDLNQNIVMNYEALTKNYSALEERIKALEKLKK